jgi:hypothetical protein
MGGKVWHRTVTDGNEAVGLGDLPVVLLRWPFAAGAHLVLRSML